MFSNKTKIYPDAIESVIGEQSSVLPAAATTDDIIDNLTTARTDRSNNTTIITSREIEMIVASRKKENSTTFQRHYFRNVLPSEPIVDKILLKRPTDSLDIYGYKVDKVYNDVMIDNKPWNNDKHIFFSYQGSWIGGFGPHGYGIMTISNKTPIVQFIGGNNNDSDDDDDDDDDDEEEGNYTESNKYFNSASRSNNESSTVIIENEIQTVIKAYFDRGSYLLEQVPFKCVLSSGTVDLERLLQYSPIDRYKESLSQPLLSSLPSYSSSSSSCSSSLKQREYASELGVNNNSTGGNTHESSSKNTFNTNNVINNNNHTVHFLSNKSSKLFSLSSSSISKSHHRHQHVSKRTLISISNINSDSYYNKANTRNFPTSITATRSVERTNISAKVSMIVAAATMDTATGGGGSSEVIVPPLNITTADENEKNVECLYDNQQQHQNKYSTTYDINNAIQQQLNTTKNNNDNPTTITAATITSTTTTIPTSDDSDKYINISDDSRQLNKCYVNVLTGKIKTVLFVSHFPHTTMLNNNSNNNSTNYTDSYSARSSYQSARATSLAQPLPSSASLPLSSSQQQLSSSSTQSSTTQFQNIDLYIKEAIITTNIVSPVIHVGTFDWMTKTHITGSINGSSRQFKAVETYVKACNEEIFVIKMILILPLNRQGYIVYNLSKERDVYMIFNLLLKVDYYQLEDLIEYYVNHILIHDVQQLILSNIIPFVWPYSIYQLVSYYKKRVHFNTLVEQLNEKWSKAHHPHKIKYILYKPGSSYSSTSDSISSGGGGNSRSSTTSHKTINSSNGSSNKDRHSLMNNNVNNNTSSSNTSYNNADTVAITTTDNVTTASNNNDNIPNDRKTAAITVNASAPTITSHYFTHFSLQIIPPSRDVLQQRLKQLETFCEQIMMA